MDINPVSKHKTKPLPYACHIDNRLYEYHPFIEDSDENEDTAYSTSRSSKRAKSISCLNYYPSVNNNTNGTKSSRVIGSTSLKRRLKSICVPSTSTNASSIQTNFSLQEREFSFDSHSVPSSTNNSDMSDLESLPDLTEDEYSPFSTPIKKVPFTINNCIANEDGTNKSGNDLFSRLLNAQEEISKPSIFEIPELVYKIIEFVDIQNTIIPQEPTPIRRKPLSYNHAFLIHGNKESAEISMKQSLILDNFEDENKKSNRGTLFNCLLVNKLFNQVTREVMNKKIVFDDAKKYGQFIQSLQHCKFQYKPEIIVLHKLFHIKQSSLDYLKDHVNFERLNWLEIYMCPKVLPPVEFFKNGGRNLKKLILTGSKVIDDDFLIMISENCPNLEVLDIRACELVSDIGIYSIGNKCHKLININLGRKQKGHLITDTSLSKLIYNNKNLSTVGLAGCYISDKIIWELAINCSHSLERLSLNNCPLLSNQSIPLILASIGNDNTQINYNYHHQHHPHNHYHHNNNNAILFTANETANTTSTPPPTYFQNLSVLELRYNYQISSWQSIIDFKRRQENRGITLLLELCETLMLRMRQQELEMDKTISQRIFNDILHWANDENDGDSSYEELIRNR